MNFKFRYYFSKRNIGLSKASNFLLSKINSKFLLFTQPDISIKKKDILNLKKIFKVNKNIIFVTPEILQKKKSSKKNRYKVKFTKKIKAACILCDVKKLKKIGFFDEDFFYIGKI